ncbi:MAG: hypothetical protein WDN01_16710 [Rhizomicrobium sp.]
MGLSSSRQRTRRIVAVLGLYALAYLFASWLDLFTTALALVRPEASEGNIYATGAAGYVSAKAWLITVAGGIAIEACLLWAILAAGTVTQHWLAHPIRSFARPYVNPWSRRVRDRSPLHMASFVIAFVPLRVLAALNNVAIAATGTAPLGRLVGLASRATTPAIGFWLVLGPLFYLLAILLAPLAARLIVWVRGGEDAARMPPDTRSTV